MTYSIIAKIDDKIGIGVTSGSIASGSRVPWAKYRIGGVATQGYTNPSLGIIILKLLEEKDTDEALDIAINDDKERELRQVGVLDKNGKGAVFTGKRTPEEKEVRIKRDVVCLGNLLKSKEVIYSLCDGFESESDIVWGIIGGLKKAHKTGGDARGDRSAAILVVGEGDLYDKILDIRVDYAHNPVEELEKIVRKVYNLNYTFPNRRISINLSR